jgi:hypothetical protein
MIVKLVGGRVHCTAETTTLLAGISFQMANGCGLRSLINIQLL